MTDNVRNELDVIWSRIEPTLKKLLPQTSFEDRMRLRALVGRLIQRTGEKLENGNMCGLIHGYFYAGQEDIRAAKILHEYDSLALCVYHIQQAIEKGMKAYCLHLGAVKMGEVNTTHKTPQIVLTTLESWPGNEMSSIISKIEHKNYRKAAKKARFLLNSDREDIDHLAKLPFKSDKAEELTIQILMKLLNELMLSNTLIERKELEVKEALLKCLPEYKSDIAAYSMLRTVRITSLCYILGCITFAHESSTRYPGGTLNPRDYTTDLGIVQAIPELLVKTDLLFAELTNLFELTKTG